MGRREVDRANAAAFAEMMGQSATSEEKGPEIAPQRPVAAPAPHSRIVRDVGGSTENERMESWRRTFSAALRRGF